MWRDVLNGGDKTKGPRAVLLGQLKDDVESPLEKRVQNKHWNGFIQRIES